MKHSNLLLALCVMISATALGTANDDWRGLVSASSAGSFPTIPAVRMHFKFGWSNVLEAAKADATIQRLGKEYRTSVSGRTQGFARILWPLDALHTSIGLVSPLRPERIAQLEVYRNHKIETQVRYDVSGLERLRKVSGSKEPPKWKRVDFAPVYDVITGVLYVRSQPLRVGDRIGVVCFPGDSPYLVVVKVERRENIRSMGKNMPVLRLSLDIRKLEVKKKKPYRAVSYAKFRSGTIWVSDDALRLPIRAEVNVFVGFVYGELESYEKL